MIKSKEFREWMKENTSYSYNVINDTVSRMRRADNIREWDETNTYLFFLEQDDKFKSISGHVKSQIRKAVRLYYSFSNIVIS